MKKFPLFCLLLLLPALTICLKAFDSPAPDALRQATAPAVAEQHMLWKATSAQGAVCYLLGSIHMAPSNLYPLPDVMEKAYAQADTVYFELDLDAQHDPVVQTAMKEAGFLPVGDHIKHHVSEATYLELDAYLQENPLLRLIVPKSRPWLATVTITEYAMLRQNFHPLWGIDFYFHKKAKADAKAIRWFETPKQQLDIFASLTDAEQELFLRQTLAEMDKIKWYTDQLVTCWQNGDEQALVELLHDEFEAQPKFYKLLLLDRNKNWIVTLEKLLKTDAKALIVVGAAHLVGPDSVINMLRQKGYTVEQE